MLRSNKLLVFSTVFVLTVAVPYTSSIPHEKNHLLANSNLHVPKTHQNLQTGPTIPENKFFFNLFANLFQPLWIPLPALDTAAGGGGGNSNGNGGSSDAGGEGGSDAGEGGGSDADAGGGGDDAGGE